MVVLYNLQKSKCLLFIAILLVAVKYANGGARARGCACSLSQLSTNRSGCVIFRAPTQKGFKCQCSTRRLFLMFPHCTGRRIQCDIGEDCPANCSSRECCLRGGGNCDGYPDPDIQTTTTSSTTSAPTSTNSNDAQNSTENTEDSYQTTTGILQVY